MKTLIKIAYSITMLIICITATAQNNAKDADINKVYNAYYDVKNALVQTNAKTAASEAKALVAAIDAVNMNNLSSKTHTAWMKVMKNLKSDAEKIANTTDIKKQRAAFTTLSPNVYTLAKTAQNQTPVYYQYCPMANNGKGGYWLSPEKAIKNPYFGSQMLSCGSIKETL